MKDCESHNTRRTLTGRSGRYEINVFGGPRGISWAEIQFTAEMEPFSQRFAYPVEDAEAIYWAIMGVESAGTERNTRKERPLPVDLGALVNRNAGEIWSNAEEALLAHLFLEGHSPVQIAIRLGRSQGSISARLTRLGFTHEWVTS